MKKTKRPTTPAGTDTISGEAVPAINNALKAETLNWILAIFCSIAVYLVVALVIRSIYHPNIDALKKTAEAILVDPRSVRPEPVEALLFRVAVVLLPLSLAFFYSFLSKKERFSSLIKGPAFKVVSIIILVAIAAMIFFDFHALNPFTPACGFPPQCKRDEESITNFDFYFGGMFLGSYFYVYVFILVPLIAFLFFRGFKKNNWEDGVLYNRLVRVVGYAVLGPLLTAILAMSCFYFPYTPESQYNFNAVYYSVTQVYAGSPMLVDGFTNTYGLYPHFLNPLFQLIGLSVTKFSTVMAILTVVAFALNFYCLRQLVKNKIILFAGMLTVIFFPFLEFKLGQAFDCNFAVYPIRYIIPSTLMVMAMVYLKNRAQRLYWITSVVMAAFVLWNPEIGLVGYLSWYVFNTFIDCYKPDGKIAWRKIAQHWVSAAVILFSVFYLYKGIIFLFYGKAPDLSLLFDTIFVFGKVGFNMLPMALIHPWHIVGLILILGLMHSVSGWYRKKADAGTAMIFLVTVLGIGYFFYFQGRSHNWQLVQSAGMSLLLLTLLGDRLWSLAKSSNVLLLNGLFVVFLLIVSLPVFEIVYNTGNIRDMISQEADKDKYLGMHDYVEANRDFILKNSEEKEKIIVMSAMQLQSLYFDGYKRRSAVNPGAMDMLLKSDMRRAEHIVSDSSFNIFYEPAVVIFGKSIQTLGLISACYEEKATNDSMVKVSKRNYKIPPRIYFQRPDQVLHRKYTDDSGGVAQRIADGLGVSPMNMGTSFSVEVLFHTNTQYYPFATVISNMDDTSGVSIYNLRKTDDYFFGFNNKGVQVTLPKNQWVYCVFNIMPNEVGIYVSGVYKTFANDIVYKQSPTKVFIGNIGQLHYYIGAIAEVAINKRALSVGEIEATFKLMTH